MPALVNLRDHDATSTIAAAGAQYVCAVVAAEPGVVVAAV